MCVNIGHGDERVIKAIQEQAATLAYANPFMATEPRARLGEKLAVDRTGRHRRLLLHERRRRGERERDQDRADVHRPPQDPRALPLVPRRNRRRDYADRRSAPLGCRARHPWRRPRCRIRITASSAAGIDVGSRAGQPRRSHSARRAADDRGVLPRNGDRHQRHPRAARRLPPGRPRAVHEVRHPDGCRRGHGRLRPHRRVVRRQPLERRPGSA